MRKIILFIMVMMMSMNLSLGSSEISLFNARGEAVAYIAEDLTIYLWSGLPTAYLESDSNDDFHIYGFNGKHLGWLINGISYDHKGEAFCVFRESYSGYTNFEPFKSFKQFKPFKSFKQFAPFRPFLSNSWSGVLCDIYLKQGRL